MKHIKKIIVMFSLFLLSGCATTTTYNNTGFGNRSDVQAFIQKVSNKDDFNSKKLTTLFNQVTPRTTFVSQTQKPRETSVTWEEYRSIFLTAEKIQNGIQFWNAHAAMLDKAQTEYGVDPEIIVGIIGVETDYGKYLGKYRVIDSLSTLAFNYPRRADFFQNELENYLLLTRDLKADPLSLYGSYAGAVGLPQFMPSNYRTLAVSANGKSADLWHNSDDAILSVANYFHHKGWQENAPIAVRLAKYNQETVNFDQEHWLLYSNFEVIKKYNDSNFYAMAVYQLGSAIKQKRERV
jgi:membrane-bound lytic murein transglycosylase B